MEKVCGAGQFVHMKLDDNNEVSVECSKVPETIINSGSLANFTKILQK
tara:strand:- start:256 stop:399 length:144 start_codon:yes stop_codon:yes gene_type:complete